MIFARMDTFNVDTWRSATFDSTQRSQFASGHQKILVERTNDCEREIVKRFLWATKRFEEVAPFPCAKPRKKETHSG